MQLQEVVETFRLPDKQLKALLLRGGCREIKRPKMTKKRKGGLDVTPRTGR